MIVSISCAQAENNKFNYDIVVDAAGGGDFTTINDAINSLPEQNFERIYILVKAGIYTEKVVINRDFISLIGEDKTTTQIQFDQLKKDWVVNKDAEGAAVINIYADDVIIDNLTLQNLMPKIGPTAYVVYGTGTRTIINNCNILNNGANTVCLMDYKTGMYYLKDCKIEGAVDFMKAMGWCHIENCSFFQKEAIASIWHAGINNPNQKMVVKNSYFDGVDNFFIGRHHFDAEFFIVDCEFSDKLADKPLYRKLYPKTPEKERPYIFGDRHYYSGSKQNKTNYAWLKDNLKEYDSAVLPEAINPEFTFDGQWNPLSAKKVKLEDISKRDGKLYLEFNQPLTVKGDLVLKTDAGKELKFFKGSGRYILIFNCENISDVEDGSEFTVASGSIVPCAAALCDGSLVTSF